jgi:hypothetical protein
MASTVASTALTTEAQLTPFGRMIQRGRIVAALVARLRAEQLFKDHPEILGRDLGPIVVIAGLQRTGTTMLHRLLAADPNARSLASWEALNPVPFPGEGADAKARRAQGKRAERGLAYLAPEFFAIHPVEADSPEEEVLLLDISFMSQAPEATLHVPSYAAWMETADSTPAYEYLAKLLKLLHWQRPGRHWVLKTPHHMEYLDMVTPVFGTESVLGVAWRRVMSFCPSRGTESTDGSSLLAQSRKAAKGGSRDQHPP